MNKLIAKLVFSVAALTVSATLVCMFSYAWLTMSGSPTVDGIQINIGGGNTIMVAPDIVSVNDNGTVSHYPGAFSQSMDLSSYDSYGYLANLAGLTPVSTADGINWVRPTYYGEDSEEAISGEVLVGQIKDISDFAVDTSLEYANLTANELTSSMLGNYAYIDFWVVSPAEGYDLRVSTGAKDDSSGSFVISRLEARQDKNSQFGYSFDMVNEATSAAVRVGFLVSNDWCTYVDNVKYVESVDYDSRYTFLKGQYLEKNSNVAFSQENSRFTIYEPNGNFNALDSDENPYYKITRPIGVVNGVISEVDVSDRLCVQLKNSWLVGAGGNGTLAEQLFMADIAGKDISSKTPAELTESFYRDHMQNIISPYVDRGLFVKSTTDLYNAVDKKGYVTDDNFAIKNVGGATEDVVISTLEKNVPQRIRMFIWLEGQDEDCVNYGEISSFIVNLELAGSNDK